MYSLKEFKEKFDPVLQNYLDNKIQEYIKNTDDPFIIEIVSYCEELVRHGGKRIRPYLAYVMYIAEGGDDIEKLLELLVGIELFHVLLLIHDDVMDNGQIRHGIRTIHKFTQDKLENENRKGDIKKVAESQAILVGDFLFAWVTEIFSNNKFPEEKLARARKYFYKTADEVILGQMLDIDITTRENPPKNLIDEKTRLKTSRYSFVRPMEMGAALASDKNVEDFCETFGTNLGITFQLQDDMLDIVGDPKLLNKNILSDILQGQNTFFTNFVFENGNSEEKEELVRALEGKIKQKDYKKIQDLFYNSGAIEKGKGIIKTDLEKSEALVKGSDLNSEAKTALLNLIELIRKRSVT